MSDDNDEGEGQTPSGGRDDRTDPVEQTERRTDDEGDTDSDSDSDSDSNADADEEEWEEREHENPDDRE